MSKLFIIAGHGNGDCGAVGNGYQEAERVRALAQRIKDFGGDDVVLSDFNLNSYRSNIIGKGLVPKGYKILELHLDSYSNTSAKGGHIIINANFKADKYDEALAKMISTMFPGRSKIIVGRTDIANVNRSANMGYNYRLMECCFISNAEDIEKFNNKMDELAKGILKCFDISEKIKPLEPIATTEPIATDKPIITSKSAEEVAKEVIQGKWGNGEERKKSLEKAGYNYSEIQAIVNKLKKPTAPTQNYFPKYNGNSSSIVDAFKSLGINSALSYRGKIAQANGIVKNAALYIGLKSHNEKMLALLKQGKLIKP